MRMVETKTRRVQDVRGCQEPAKAARHREGQQTEAGRMKEGA